MDNTKEPNDLEDKLKELRELLEKNMSNKGLGGPGSVKAGAVLPSINTMTPKASSNSKTPSVNPVQQSKKNPIKQAQQIQNKDIKDIRMKEAQQKLALQKEEVVKYDDNGQWSLDKADSKVKTIIKRKGESSGKTKDERVSEEKRSKELANQKELEQKMSDPEYKKKALLFQTKQNENKKAQNENYDKAVQTDDPDARPPVAQKKRSATFIQQFNRRKDAPDKKLINKEKTGKIKMEKSIDELFEELFEARQELEYLKKSAREQILEDLEKSGYKGYTEADNARRKKNNLGEDTGIRSMPRIKKYGGSGPDAADRAAKEAKKKSKKNPVKQFSPEEIKAENEKRGLSVKKTAREEILEALEKGRCWEGYKPVKGKKPYEKGSCEPVSKQDIEVAPENSNNRKTYLDEFEKEEKPFHGYNKDKHSKEGGMSAKAREKYNRETGGNLQKPVTSKEAKNSEKKANRRKSFCARMSGVKGPTSKDGKLTRKGAALKRWDC